MNIDFDKQDGLVPAIVQDAVSRKVLMLGYMNEEALKKTREEGVVTFYSRSQEKLWTKGETSGNHLDFVDVEEDCDHDTLLVWAQPRGPVCHKGTDTCFGEKNSGRTAFLEHLQQVVHERKQASAEESYTSKLFSKGINKIAQKVGEEAVELVIEAKDNDKERFLNETADLLFHLTVLLESKDISYDEVIKVLEERHRK